MSQTLQNVTLEISAKSLFRKDDAFVLDLYRSVFRHWWSLLKHSQRVSLLWWLSDGTDILEYDGDMDRAVEWGMWQGFAHRTVQAPDKDPHGDSILTHARVYRPEPVVLTYGDLRRIVGLMKQAGHEVLGKPIEVGIPFDPGSEFCTAPFRYERHPELLLLKSGEHIRCIDATGRLNADPHRFAGFPQGLPEGTLFGDFFGRQAHPYMCDLGFDYIWFSNSFGYGRSPYAFGGAGQFFDGERYAPEGNHAVRDSVLDFWRRFRAGCPHGRVECRGTDFTVGMNLVNHATPYAALYAGNFNITPPPNTPWPALTRNHGLALAGYLTQISAFRGPSFPYRFYVMDPWFCNNPWMDRWERNPHDIYLSTAVTRLNEHGEVAAFNEIKVLSIDGSWGELPERIPDEVVPHLKRAVAHRPDDTPPLVWVYPFTEYHRYTFDETARMAEPMAGDLLMVQALNTGLPLTGVVTTDALVAGRARHPERFAGRVLVSPVPDADSAWEAALAAHLDAGHAVLCYGPTDHAGPAWLARLGLAHAAPLDGAFALQLSSQPDRYAHGAPGTVCEHHPALSAGGIREVAALGGGLRILSTVARDGATRVAASVRGRLAWVRGTSSVTVAGVRGRNLDTHDPLSVHPCETLFRHALAACGGWDVAVSRAQPAKSATHLAISRCRNAFMFAGFSPDDSVVYDLRTPFGAPLLPGRNTVLAGGRARLPANRWFHEPVRLFVEQSEGTVDVHAHPPANSHLNTCFKVDGLRDATVRFFPQSGQEERTQVLLNPDLWLLAIGKPFEMHPVDSDHGRYIELHNITGTLTIAWWDETAHA